jgi:hypothetical protein
MDHEKDDEEAREEDKKKEAENLEAIAEDFADADAAILDKEE